MSGVGVITANPKVIYTRADQGRLRPKIKYDSVRFEMHALQEKANCKLNLGSGMLVFFFPFFENLGSYVYDSMRAYGSVLERHQRYDFFVEQLYGMCARALAVHALARSRARPPATAPALLLSEAAPQSGQMSCGR